MIESEEKRKRLTDMITRWCEFTMIKPYLRDLDIPSLVSQIIDEFYHIHLCCSHQVRELCEGIYLEFEDFIAKENVMGTISGSYCKDCAEEYKKELDAKEIKFNNDLKE